MAARDWVGDIDTDNASLRESDSPYFGYTGVAGSATCLSTLDAPSFFNAPPHPNHPLFHMRYIENVKEINISKRNWGSSKESKKIKHSTLF